MRHSATVVAMAATTIRSAVRSAADRFSAIRSAMLPYSVTADAT